MKLSKQMKRVRRVVTERPGPEDLAAVLRKYPAGSAVSSVNAVALMAATWSSFGGPVLLVWCLATLFLNYRSYRRTIRARGRKVRRVSLRAKRRLLMYAFVGGLPWGLIAAAAVIFGTGYDQMVTFVCAAGMTAGATFMLHRVTAACLMYSFGVIVPSVLTGLVVDFWAYWPVAVYSVMFVSYLTIAGRKSGETARDHDRSVKSLSSALAEVKATKTRMTHMVYVDHTTGMPNRSAFVERLAEEVECAEKNASNLPSPADRVVARAMNPMKTTAFMPVDRRSRCFHRRFPAPLRNAASKRGTDCTSAPRGDGNDPVTGCPDRKPEPVNR